MSGSGPIRAEDVEARRPEFLWPVDDGRMDTEEAPEGRIPRSMISVIAGKPDVGKGMVAVRIGADLSRVGLKVLHSAWEDDPGLITAPRYRAAGANMKNIHLWRFRLPVQFNELAEYVRKHSIDLLIIDPLASHLSGGITRHSDRIREVTDPLTGLIEGTGTAVIVIEHALKRIPSTADPLSAIGGSGSGLPAATRMGFIFGTDPQDDDRRILAHVKGNICKKRPAMAFEVDEVPVNVTDSRTGESIEEPFPALLFDEETVFDAMRLLKREPSHGKIGRPADKRAQAAEWLTTYLFQAHQATGQGVKSGKVIEDAKQFGMAEKTLRNAAKEMKVVKTPPGGGRNVVWSLPDEIMELLAGGDDEAIEAAGEQIATEAAEAVQEAAEGVDTTGMDAELAALLGDGTEPQDAAEGEGGEDA